MAVGSGFNSISSLAYGVRPLEFNLADEGKQLLLTAFKPQKSVAAFNIMLYDGQQLQIPVAPEQTKNSR
jgi:hypothetical protein